jgi:Ca-activated chloride channel family protein
MIRWAAAQYLYLLFAIPLVIAVIGTGGWLKRRNLRRLADPELVPRLTDSRNPRLAALKLVCLVLGLLFTILAAARPQWGEKLQVYKGRGIDIVIALDASKSMLATDVKPSRLSRAKTEITSLLDNLSTNQVGIVAFAGDAHVMCPLTPDTEAAKLFLDIIDPENMPRPGTDISRAVEAAASLFNAREQGSKALLLVTDGDNLEGDPAAATARAARAGIRIFAVGVGTLEGSTVPESNTSTTTYKKDQDDKIVISRLAERLLLVMARATDGRYFRSESVNLDALAAALEQLQKKQITGGEYVEYEERYQYFLLAAFILTFAGLVLSDRRGAWFPRPTIPRFRLPGFRSLRGFAGRGVQSALVLLLALLGCARPVSADVGARMREGGSLERRGKYEEAVRKYQDALVLEPDNVRIRYNLGRALYRMNKPAEAAAEFQLGLLSKARRLKARSLYNIGNCQFKEKGLDAAIASYTQALMLDPGDQQAKQNLEYCWKMKDQPKQQKSDSTGTKPPPPQPPQDQQQPQRQQAQERKGEISKEQAERMLQALQSREREDMKKQQKQPKQPGSGGKDW